MTILELLIGFIFMVVIIVDAALVLEKWQTRRMRHKGFSLSPRWPLHSRCKVNITA